MKTDFDMLSTCPPDETPAEDRAEARAEGRRYIELLRKHCGPEPEGSVLRKLPLPKPMISCRRLVRAAAVETSRDRLAGSELLPSGASMVEVSPAQASSTTERLAAPTGKWIRRMALSLRERRLSAE